MPPKILIVRFSSIGDIVLTSPIIRCVKKQLNAEIHFCTKRSYGEILEGNPYISKHWLLNGNLAKLSAELKLEKFDLIIDLHQNWRSRYLSFQLGSKTIGFNKLNIKKWLAVNVKVNILPPVHLVNRYFDAVKKIGVENDNQGLDFFLTTIAKDDQSYREIQLKEYDVAVLSAAHATKKIPIELWKKIIPNVSRKIVLIGGVEDQAMGEAITSWYPDQCINKVGEWTIQQSAFCISGCHQIITGDTGMMHIAAAFQKHIHVIWGNTVPAFGMYPYYAHQNNFATFHEVPNLRCRPCSKIGFSKCPKGHFKCMMEQQPVIN